MKNFGKMFMTLGLALTMMINALAFTAQANTISETRGVENSASAGYKLVAHGDYRIGAEETRNFTVRFYAGEKAYVGLEGDGDTDLDVYIYDPYGRLVTQNENNTDVASVNWSAAYTVTYTIKIINRGNIYNDFYVAAYAD